MEYKQTEIVGEFLVNLVSVNGYEVPNLTATIHTGDQDGLTTLTLDRRFGITAPNDECRKWAPIIANAMAIGAGYSCHGENSEKMNPFKIQLRKMA